jgi:hypothetical protein
MARIRRIGRPPPPQVVVLKIRAWARTISAPTTTKEQYAYNIESHKTSIYASLLSVY